MRIAIASVLVLTALAAACGDSKPADEPADDPPAVPVSTFADDTIGLKDKARIRTEAAVETHREALQQSLDTAEGAPAEPAEPPQE